MITLATALKPSVIIADEPTANLDPGTRMETLARLEELRDEAGVAILLITHDFGVVARLADRVAVMYAGEIVETSDVRTIFRRPDTPRRTDCWRASRRSQTIAIDSCRCAVSPPIWKLSAGVSFLERCYQGTFVCRIEPAPALEPYEGDAGHLVACYNSIVVDRELEPSARHLASVRRRAAAAASHRSGVRGRRSVARALDARSVYRS